MNKMHIRTSLIQIKTSNKTKIKTNRLQDKVFQLVEMKVIVRALLIFFKKKKRTFYKLIKVKSEELIRHNNILQKFDSLVQAS